MLLDIIVPHYREPWEVVKPFVDMINGQRGIDFSEFRVLMIHDGVEKFPDEYLEGPANIVQICQQKSGVSAARNRGIEMSDAEWINFSDCDDCYSSVVAMWIVLNALRQEKCFDLLWSPFYMIKENQLKVFNDYNAIFIHNKYYRRSFLNEKNIRFCENLFMSEDSAFNGIIEMRMEYGKIGKINVNEPIYAWCRREGSITMDPKRWVINAEGHFDRNLYVLGECEKNACGRPDLMSVRTMCDAYSMLNQPRALVGDASRICKRVAVFYAKYRRNFLNTSRKDLERLLNISDLEAGVTDDIRKTRISIQDWLEQIEKQYG